MRLTIISMRLENFKGIKDRTITLNGNAKIDGQNGSGKTTLADAYFWVFDNTNYEGKSNPAIFPLNVEECTPSVEIEMLIDDAPVKICKKQTRKVTESNDGTRKIALTNSYFVNEVPLSERDMQKKLSDMGFDFEKFSTLTNPNAFLAEKKDVQRKVLFSMASSHTDYEIASMMDGVSEATTMLKTYSTTEVRAMMNASLKKIAENYGKNGEILNAKIEGLENAKIDDDFAEIELQKNLLTEKLEECKTAIHAGELIEVELNSLREGNLKLQFELSGLKNKIQAEKQAEESKLLANRREVEEKAKQLDRDIRRMEGEVQIYEDSFKSNQSKRKTLETKLSEVKALVMDNGKTVCPVCNRSFEQSKVNEIKREFEADKKIKINDVEMLIQDTDSILAIKRAELAEIKRRLEKATVDRQELETLLKQPLNALQGNMDEPTVYDEQIATLESELEKSNQLIETKKATMPNMSVLKAEEVNLNGQIRDCEIQLSRASLNDEIDNKIEMLREQQIQYEQNKANSEKILYQLDLIQKKKNEMLTDEINKHFKIVKFSFFEYLKNGNYSECCKVFVGDRELGAALNNAMQIRAKIDICNGLQNFYNEHYPVWIDNSEALDTNNQALIEADTQVIRLCVTDDKDLTIKEV